MNNRATTSEWRKIMEEGNPRKGPLVVVSLAQGSDAILHGIMERVRGLSWDVKALTYYLGELPPGLPAQGAFLEKTPDDALVRTLRKSGCKVIRLAHLPHPQDRFIPAVMEDITTSGRLAAEHFAERHFRHVGFVGWKPLSDNKPLYRAFRARALELGCECHLLEFSPLDEKEQPKTPTDRFLLRQRELEDWIRRVPKPIGLFGFTDFMAGRMTIASLDAGFAVPQQVAVLGHGNYVALCESAPVPLSSIDVGYERQGEAAVGLMQDLLAGKPGPAKAVRIPPRGLVVRQSTDVLAAADPAVARAIRFIWDNLQRNLSVHDVAAAVAMHRRTLERLFHDQVGHGINTELNRRRLEYCQELLRTTKLPVVEIAARAGFRSKDYLHELFRRRFGVTPRKWRMQTRMPTPE